MYFTKITLAFLAVIATVAVAVEPVAVVNNNDIGNTNAVVNLENEGAAGPQAGGGDSAAVVVDGVEGQARRNLRRTAPDCYLCPE